MGSEHPDWLPLDWKVSMRNRNFGRKDKCYIHPSNGLMFNSKPDVLEYLKISRESSNPKLGIKNTVAEKLPPGWIKEIRTKKNKGKIRRDLYYYDPVSGRQFRSVQEVFRYLKYSGKAVSQLDDKGHTSSELVDKSQSSSTESKGQRSIDERGNEIMTDQENVKSGQEDDAAAPKNVENPVVEERQGECYVGKKPQDKVPRANGEEPQNGGTRVSNRLASTTLNDDAEDQSSEPGSKTAAENNTNIPESKKENSCAVQTPDDENNRECTQRKWVSIEMKTRDEDGGSVDSTKIERESERAGSIEEQKSVEVEGCLKDIILMDPCIQFAIKTLTGAIPIQDVNNKAVCGGQSEICSLESAVETKDDGLK